MAVREDSYREMISTLKSGGKQIYELTNEALGMVDDCVANMDGDENIEDASQEMKSCSKDLLRAAKAALRLAELMEEELDEYVNAKKLVKKR